MTISEHRAKGAWLLLNCLKKDSKNMSVSMEPFRQPHGWLIFIHVTDPSCLAGITTSFWLGNSNNVYLKTAQKTVAEVIFLNPTRSLALLFLVALAVLLKVQQPGMPGHRVQYHPI